MPTHRPSIADSAFGSDDDRFQPVAALLAFLIPGAGHAYLGQRRRGLCIFLGVFFLFFGGLFIAGIDAVDSGLYYHNAARNFLARVTGSAPPPPIVSEDGEPVWFLGQAFVGPTAFIVDYLHQFHFKVVVPSPTSQSLTTKLRDALPGETRDPATGAATMSPGGKEPNVHALGRVGEVGMLYAAMAGLLNLICIIDAGFNRRREGDDREDEPGRASVGTAAPFAPSPTIAPSSFPASSSGGPA